MTSTTTVRRTTDGLAARIRSLLTVPIMHPAGLVVLGLVLGLIAWLRLTPAGRETIWAEDGHQFLQQAIEYGPIPAIGLPYEGYMHLLPRLIGGVASIFPITWWAQIISLESCLIAGAVGVLVYVVSGAFPLANWSRLLLAGTTVLAPTLVNEVLGNGANMYTFALWGAFWIFLARPRTWRWSIVAGVIVLIFASTAVQLGALLPLLLLRRSRKSIPMVVGFILGLIFQLYGYTHSVRSSRPSWPLVGTTLDGYIHQVVLGSWFESAHVGALVIVYLGWITACAVLVPYLMAVYVLLFRTEVERFWARTFAVILPVASIGFWFLSFDLNNLAVDYANSPPSALVAHVSTVRYAVLPAMLLWALLLVAVGWQRPALQAGSRFWRVARIVVPSAIILSSLVNFIGIGTTDRNRGPQWDSSLVQGERYCDHQPNRQKVTLFTAPGGGWVVTLLCGNLEQRIGE